MKIPAPVPVCQRPIRFSRVCPHGGRSYLEFGCGDMACEACANRWRMKVRNNIRDGMKAHPVPYKFLTLTFAGGEESIDSAMVKWRKFRKKYLSGHRFYRVFEPHKSGKGVHIHAIHTAPLPDVPRIRPGQSLASFLRSLSGEAAHFVRGVQALGFGPILYNRPTYGSPSGAAAYLSKYLTKVNARSLTRSEGRRARIAEGSRGWKPAEGKVKNYVYGAGGRINGSVSPAVARCCDTRNRPMEEKAARNERLALWLAQIPSADFLERLRITIREVRRARSRLQSTSQRLDEGKTDVSEFDYHKALLARRVRYLAWLRLEAQKEGYYGPCYLIDEVALERLTLP